MRNQKPRDFSFAQISKTVSGETAIFINAHRIGGSIVRIEPAEARRAGQRLIEMADWMVQRANRQELVKSRAERATLIFQLRNGGETYRHIAHAVGLSRERVRQLYFRKLKEVDPSFRY